MKKSFTVGFLLFSVAFIFAQPANDNCNTATIVAPNGTCINGTTVGADDSWQGSVGCQGGGTHPEVWYTFTSTGSQAQFTITASSPWSGNVELILVEGTCSGTFTLVGSQCGPSPLTTTFNGLLSGTTYYYTISNANGGTPGPFQTCVNTLSPPTLAGQDCNNAAILCNSSTFSQSTSNAGFGSQEVTAANSCWGAGGERQSKWFKFTAGCSGTLEFNINPINANDDYDWALWNITSDPNGCTTKGNSIACNWSGCKGSTGISSCAANEPGAQSCGASTGGDPCGAGNFPRAWGNWSSPGGGASTCLSSTVNLVAGNVYALLVDNFTFSNSGFSLTFGGACGGGTAKIGPDANFTYTAGSCGTYDFTKTCPTSNSTFLWQFGDGTTATTQDASHTYSTFGTFVISLQVTDALGCVAIFSQTITVNSSVTPAFNAVAPICSGGALSPLPTTSLNGITGIWSPALNNTATTTYTFTPTAGQCATTATLTITVNNNVTPTFNAVAPICSGGTLSPLPTTSLNGITGSWLPALNNTATTTYTFTPTAGQCATTASLTITVNNNVTPTFNTVAPICSGGTLSPLPTTSLNGITGTWSPALNNTATTIYTFTPTAGQCATTATLTITVNSNVTPTFNAVTPICSGGTLSPLPTTSLDGITGTWSPALNNTATTTYTFTPTAGQCATTASLTITVNPILSPTINCGISTTSSIIFNWAAVNGATGYNVSYQVNGGSAVNIGSIGNVLLYQVSGLSGGDNVTISVTPTGGAGTCFMASGINCAAISCVPPTANISYSSPFCSGNSTPQTVSLTGTGTFTGGVFSALTGLTLNSTTGEILPSTSVPGTYTVTYTVAPGGGCPGVTSTTSITIYSVTPSVSITASTTSICTGGSVTFTATPTNGGTTPPYQWKINGVNVSGQTASTFTTTTLNNGDIITVTMSSSDPCANPVTATSNAITVTATTVVPSVSIAASTTSICTGGSVTFTATPTNGGTAPTYQWKINGVNVTGQTASTFTTATLSNGDIVTVTVSSSDPCANPITATSNAITITTGAVVPSVSIATTTTSICTGGSVTFTTTATNGGSTPTYQWKINGVNVTGQTGSTFTTTTLSNGDIVTVAMSSNDPCANPTNAVSNTIPVIVNTAPILVIIDPQSVCSPFTVDLTSPAVTSGSSIGSTYSYWTDAACTIPLSNPNSVAVTGIYYIRSQSSGGCFTIKPVSVTIETNIPGIRYADVSVTANTPVALQARSIQPNSTYQWSPTRGLTTYSNQDVVFSFDQKTEYIITITSQAGCVTVDTQLVDVKVTGFGIFVPKAWTPNGDGYNDFLSPLTLNIAKINYFRIFSRWGQLVFETNTLNSGWNGIFNGKPQPGDVYTWTAEAVTITGEIIRRSGNSVLIR